MQRMFLIALLAAVFAPYDASATEPVRQWQATNGKRVDAAFESYDEKTGMVTLLVRTQVRLSSLDKEAKAYVEERIAPKPITYRRRVGNVIPGVKYCVDFMFDSVKRLPTVQQLEELSDQVEIENPGYQRYFVLFFLPGMPLDAGAFATAHRDPECEVKILWYMCPGEETQKRVRDFYGIK